MVGSLCSLCLCGKTKKYHEKNTQLQNFKTSQLRIAFRSPRFRGKFANYVRPVYGQRYHADLFDF